MTFIKNKICWCVFKKKATNFTLSRALESVCLFGKEENKHWEVSAEGRLIPSNWNILNFTYLKNHQS